MIHFHINISGLSFNTSKPAKDWFDFVEEILHQPHFNIHSFFFIEPFPKDIEPLTEAFKKSIYGVVDVVSQDQLLIVFRKDDTLIYKCISDVSDLQYLHKEFQENDTDLLDLKILPHSVSSDIYWNFVQVNCY